VLGVSIVYFYFFHRDITVKIKDHLAITNIGISEI